MMKFEAEIFAELLIANGVTFATDTDVPSKWISVEDRLPEIEEWVICSCRGGFVEVLRYDYFMECWDRSTDPTKCYRREFVTHWMPMPEPPKEE